LRFMLPFMLPAPPELLFVLRFMFPFMFEFDMFEFDVFEFDMFEFDVFEFDMFELLAFDMFEFDMLALLAFVVLVLSPPPQAARPARPTNARSAKVLRIDRSPELL
jgi:hypothetical protein